MVVTHNSESNWYYNQRYDNKEPDNMKGCFYSLFGVLIIAILSLLLSSCKTIKYVPVEKVVTEYKTNTVHDSVYLEVLKHDSVVIEKFGDTVFVNKWHILYKDRFKETIKIDTLIKTDSIQVPYPVEKNLSKWEQIKIDARGIAIGICIGVVLIIIVCFIVRAYRKT